MENYKKWRILKIGDSFKKNGEISKKKLENTIKNWRISKNIRESPKILEKTPKNLNNPLIPLPMTFLCWM